MRSTEREALVADINRCVKALASADDNMSRANAELMIKFLRNDLAEMDLLESPLPLAARYSESRRISVT